MSGQIVNRRGVAEAFGVRLTAVDDWLRRGCPFVKRPEKKGGAGWKIDLAAVLHWHREQERKNALGDVAQINETEARRRKLAAEAALVEHELAIKQGHAVLIDDAVAVLTKKITDCRSRLLGLGHKLAPMVAIEPDAAQCEAIINSSVHEALSGLTQIDSSEIRNPSNSVGQSEREYKESDEPLGASSRSHSKRVGGQKPKTKSGVKRRTGAVVDRQG